MSVVLINFSLNWLNKGLIRSGLRPNVHTLSPNQQLSQSQ